MNIPVFLFKKNILHDIQFIRFIYKPITIFLSTVIFTNKVFRNFKIIFNFYINKIFYIFA